MGRLPKCSHFGGQGKKRPRTLAGIRVERVVGKCDRLLSYYQKANVTGSKSRGLFEKTIK